MTNHQYGENQVNPDIFSPNWSNLQNWFHVFRDQVSVVGFDVPNSPEASYNNDPGNEDRGRDPPLLPPHLHHSLLDQTTSNDTLPSPQNVTLNHLHIDNREPPRSVVALGVTHRFRSKFVTVVLYKPVPRR